MRPLLQHASRLLVTNATTSTRGVGSLASSICRTCQNKRSHGIPTNYNTVQQWSRRAFSNSRTWLDERKPPDPSQPISMPPPAAMAQDSRDNRAAFTDSPSLLERQERLQREFDAIQRQAEEQKVRERARKVQEEEEARQAQERIQEQQRLQQQEQARMQEQSIKKSENDIVDDNIARVPDDQLPSHRERQRWDLSKRLSDAMDDLLPKIALVTQKVNTYTGTDYSGVEALRREIQEQEQLVKARRLAIDSKKQALDTALAHQAASQKEVVALLERKHSWSSSDLERYMSLIRSEHINDQAVREGKEAVSNAEKALEDARAQLEKRERAQYHEEQIWSDTIRRNSTWVTFGLMGVNIFLLLLSLAILEPWRRKRMVREIKTALEAQILAMESTPASTLTVAPSLATQETTSASGAFDLRTESTTEFFEKPEPVAQAAPPALTASTGPSVPTQSNPAAITSSDTFVGPIPGSEVIGATPLHPEDVKATSQEDINATERAGSEADTRSILERWRRNVSAAMLEVVSDRVIEIRRIDYTAAVLQGAAAGAVITAAIVAMLRGN